ncbi:MAG: DUF3298 and DUF4163 domain-containing protein [Lewinellaceae bacterium]|nr:DUF3298 and DUF4163 domain-containing protein [Phaeodactylibacter sp.]MCB0615732.1 DUF3298 and DUF4163 domain-containing protein [Phaeodactylibacter sp.]MCB9349195.1 DUF3298 and DUF4163 domain-containing protein [Lewinellaceae bacterium]
MKNTQVFIIFFAMSLAVSCQPNSKGGGGDSKTDGEPASPALSFEQQTFSRQSAGCEQDSSYCAEVRATYPLATAGPEPAIQNINDTIHAYLKLSLAVFASSTEDIPESLDAIADNFLREYEAAMAEDDGFESAWEVEVQGEVLFQSKQYVSVQLNTFSYAGGAHPNSFTYLINFDARTGAVLLLPDLVRDTTRLKELAESAFREARELGPDESLSDAGYFWEGPFTWPENYALTSEGLYFVYNPYEVASYAAGPTEFIISREKLSGLLKE